MGAETYEVIGCHDCPFNYDAIRCKHPRAPKYIEGANRLFHVAVDRRESQPRCPLRGGDAKLTLTWRFDE